MSALSQTIMSYLQKDGSFNCIHKNIKQNEVFLALDKQNKGASINVNEFIEYISTKLGRSFSVTNVKKLIQAKGTGGSFQLPSKKKINFHFDSDKIRYNSKDDTNSFLWIATAQSHDVNFGLVLLKVKIHGIDETLNDVKNSKSDNTRNRIPNFKINETLGQKSNWTYEQKQFAQQCACSFQLLENQTLQFHNDFWTGVLMNATDETIEHFIRVYSSESIQVFRRKKNEIIDSRPFKIDQTYKRIWNIMDHTKLDDTIKTSTMEVQQIKSIALRCFKMDDPEKLIKKPTTDQDGRPIKKRKAIGSFANKCQSRMNIKVMQFLNKGIKVGETIAVIEDSLKQHNHDVGCGIRNKEKFHPLVIKRGKELFDKINVGRSQFVRFMLSYCQKDLIKDVAALPENKAIRWIPNKNDAAFWPNKKRLGSLYRRLYQETYGRETLKDQVRLQELIKNIKQNQDIWNDDDYLYFQPYVPDKHDEETGETEKGQEFLLIYQNQFQRDMFAKFGKDVTGIDCTYNTTKYGLKLYWLVVIDNLRHIQPAGFFVTQYETDQTIENCLQRIKTHMKDLDDGCEPNIWIGDKDSAQMNACQNVYPNSLYWLCLWHVQQSFNRTGRSKCRNQQEAGIALDLLSKMMYTRSKSQCDQLQKQLLLRGRSRPLRDYLKAEWFQEDEKKNGACAIEIMYTRIIHIQITLLKQ